MSGAADFSVVIPALDEAARLPATIAAARAALARGTEIIVVDGGSRDGTPAVAAAAGARVLRSETGRGTQMRAGAAAARGRIIVLLHADTRLPPGSGAAIEAALADPTVAGGAFSLAFDTDAAAPLPPLLRAYQHWLNSRSRRFGMVTGDQAMFARADTLRAIGGVPDVPLFEDVRLSRSLRLRGRLVLLEAVVDTSPRLFLQGGTVRTIAMHLGLRALHAMGVAPARLARWYPYRRPVSAPADW
jgi:rSAM/selenodomain-associated transferase 2